jgi:hypothetical protein
MLSNFKLYIETEKYIHPLLIRTIARVSLNTLITDRFPDYQKFNFDLKKLIFKKQNLVNFC